MSSVAIPIDDIKKRKLEEVPESTSSSPYDKKLKPTDTPVDDNEEDEPTQESQPESAFEWICQIKISNFNKHLTAKVLDKELKKTLVAKNHPDLVYKCKKAPTWNYALVSFKKVEDKELAMKLFAGMLVKNSVLEISDWKMSTPRSRDDSRSNNRDNSRSNKPSAKSIDTSKPPEVLLNDQVTPLWNQPYETQLIKMQESMRKVMKSWKRKLAECLKGPVYNDFQKSTVEWVRSIDEPYETITESGPTWTPDGLLCSLSAVIPSPILTGYRNKCEFTCGMNLSNEKCVGFLLGLYKDGIVSVLDVKDTLHVSEKAKAIVGAFQGYIRKSEFPVYDRVTKEGFYRLVVTKTFLTGESMVIVQYDPKGVDPGEVSVEEERLKHFFGSLQGESSVTTVLTQEYSGVHNGFIEDAPIKVILGDGYIHEELLGLRFRVSPTAFFQINTPATELLYSKVRELCALESFNVGEDMNEEKTEESEKSKNVQENETDRAMNDAPAHETNNAGNEELEKEAPGVVLLDLCCGTGTIGITMASHVKKVVGVDIVASAIEDAKFNAAANGITNITFIASKVESAMDRIFKEHVSKKDKVVVVLDPPRSGVHASVISCIRRHKGVSRVVYVACNAEVSMQNFVELCRPPSKKIPGAVFKPTGAFVFDLFPHTPHTELVVAFERDYSTTPPEKIKEGED
ncbi:tRNA methyltransferase 2 [Nowakowskiella sp. JEL0407]|nr:tRNA methyltransferase 2 [Nowakowskiella sp. JEL0407]